MQNANVVFVDESKPENVKGNKALEKCETEDGAMSLQKAALAKYDDPQLIAEVCGVDWKAINTKELFYHRSCK